MEAAGESKPLLSGPSFSDFKSIPLGDSPATTPPIRQASYSEERRNSFFLPVTAILTLVFFLVFSIVANSSDLHEAGAIGPVDLPDQSRLYLYSPTVQKYLHSDSGSLTFAHEIPWMYGSTLQVVRFNQDCFQLKTAENLWLRVDAVTSHVKADESRRLHGAYFAAFRQSGGVNLVSIKLCGKDQWLQAQDSNSDSPVFPPTLHVASKTSFNSGSARSLRSSKRKGHKKAKASPHIREDPTADENLSFSFRIERRAPIHGVSLGGWFIPEPWMNRQFYNDSHVADNTGALCDLVRAGRGAAEKRMAKHLASWIEEEDFREIARLGFNSIRLPVGYWNVVQDPYHMYVPGDSATSLRVLDTALDLAAKYNLSMLLDLRGAPGSQNGLAGSGCSAHPANWMTNENLELSVKAVEAMAKRYGGHRALYGIAPVNSPAIPATSNISMLGAYYSRAYSAVRKHCRSCAVVVSVTESNFALFRDQLREPAYYNVVADLHVPDRQGRKPSLSDDHQVANVDRWRSLLKTMAMQFPIMIGEWSMVSLDEARSSSQALVDANINAFKPAIGWYLWTWKVDADTLEARGWSVQYQHLLRNGLYPV